ncbi:MAG: hypothetical protein ACI87E_003174 [Mariniblastus sp.]
MEHSIADLAILVISIPINGTLFEKPVPLHPNQSRGIVLAVIIVFMSELSDVNRSPNNNRREEAE